MPLPARLELGKETYLVYKTGIPFYDAARLIGVAHLFFGTASAEVEDKGNYWEVSGVGIKRDEQQVLWIINRLNPTKTERKLFQKDGVFLWKEFAEFFSERDVTNRKGSREKLKAEYDVALQIGTRGIDPLSKYEVLAPRSTGEILKQFKAPFQEVAVATLGRAFAASVRSFTKRQREEIYILPVFRERFVISGFLEYERSFVHASGGWVAAVWAALSILLDLTTKRLPVIDFAYTREAKAPTGQPIFSDSGYLGLGKLCIYWWNGVKEGKQETLNLLHNFREFLENTSSQNTHEQVQALARHVAAFIANPNAEALTKMEQLKARILANSQTQQVIGGTVARRLLGRGEHLREVKAMLQLDLPEVPWQISEALAKALGFDEGGWMNQFTRLENTPNFSQFIQQVERIISRGCYREQQEKGQQPNIREAMIRAHDLANTLRGIGSALQDEKAFRAWKAIFLLDVLSRARMRTEGSSEQTGEGEARELSEEG